MHLKTITQRKFKIGQKNSLAGFIIFGMIDPKTNGCRTHLKKVYPGSPLILAGQFATHSGGP
jgi:hypothetical protein